MQDALLAAVMARVHEYMQTGHPMPVLDPPALDEASQLMRFAAKIHAEDHAEVDPSILAAVGLLHWCRYKALPSPQGREDLKSAVYLFDLLRQIGPGLVPPSTQRLLDDALEEWTEMATDGAIHLIRQFDETGALADLDNAIALFTQAIESLSAGRTSLPAGHTRGSGILHRDRPGCLSALGAALSRRFEFAGREADIDKAIDVGREAVRLTPAGAPDRPLHLTRLAIALRNRFESFGDRADLEEAVEADREAIRLVADDDPERAMFLSNLCRTLQCRFANIGHGPDLDEAVEAGREAVRLTPTDDHRRPDRLFSLSIALATRYDKPGRAPDLAEAVSVSRQAVQATPAAHPERGRYLANLGGMLVRQARQTGSAAYLDDGVATLRLALLGLPPAHPDLDVVLAGLTGALLTKFERTGRLADLDEAIDFGRRSVASSPPGAVTVGGELSNLQFALVLRYGRTGQRADLDEAIEIGHQADRRGAIGRTDRVLIETNMGMALRARFVETQDPEDLREAVALARRVVSHTPPGSAFRGNALYGLCAALLLQSQAGDQQRGIDEVERVCRAAVAEVPAGDQYHADLAGIFSTVLMARFRVGGVPADLDEAIALTRQGVAAMPRDDDPHRARMLMRLGTGLRVRFGRTGDPADLHQAVNALEAVVGNPAADPALQVSAASDWAYLAMEQQDYDGALRAFTAAVRMMPVLAWRGVDRLTREGHLARWPGLAADAAAAAVAAGRPEQAVELLEQGRSVLWSQALQERVDLSALAEAAPETAARLAEIRNLLDAAASDSYMSPIGPGLDPGRQRDERARSAREWDELVIQVRRIPGFAHFLAPLPFAELRRAAVDGPVIVINTSVFRCDALVVSVDGVAVVPLPGLTLENAIELCNTLLTTADRAAEAGLAGMAALRTNLNSIMLVLWHTVADPVLRFLGYDHPHTEGQPWPRVWWCPVGPLAFLPLHGAGHEQEAAPNPGSVLDRVISSYTPTLTALIRARLQVGTTKGTALSVLAVALPDAPHQVPLPFVEEELAIVGQHLAPPIKFTRLVGAEATRERVMQALDDHDWAHFCCHGGQDLADPGQSGVFLWDSPLTVRDVATLRLKHAQLAYLSACQTALGGTRLPDEAVHVAAGLQLAGFRHVIATLWATGDREAPAVADTVYRILTAGGQSQAPGAARALHVAVRELRERCRSQPQIWAPYIHLGA